MKERDTQDAIREVERLHDRSRRAWARGLSLLSVALFLMGPLIITVVVMVAKADGQLPPYDQWGPGLTNHGQWHGIDSNPAVGHLHYGFDRALLFPLYAFCAAIASCIMKPNWTAAVVLVLSIVFDFVLLVIFLPLFD